MGDYWVHDLNDVCHWLGIEKLGLTQIGMLTEGLGVELEGVKSLGRLGGLKVYLVGGSLQLRWRTLEERLACAQRVQGEEPRGGSS